MDIFDFVKYDPQNEHKESVCYCVGAGEYLDISQFEESEVIFSAPYNTYCVKYFCGKHDECQICPNHLIYAKIK